MRILMLFSLGLFSAGCASLANRALDSAGAPIAKQVIDYCASPEYRRTAMRALVNGRLAPIGAAVEIRCPSD